MKESTTSIIAWFTQPDILRPMIGGGGEVFQPDMYKPYMTIGMYLFISGQCLLKGTLHFHHRWQQSL